MTISSLIYNKFTLIPGLVIVCAIVLQSNTGNLIRQKFDEFTKGVSENARSNLLTPNELSQYNGVDKEYIYLAILGMVYDVTKGKKHYEEGASYNYFVGKDGSRSFITGNFNDNSPDSDHVLDLTCDELFVLTNWKDTFRKTYTPKGKLIGRYYNGDGSKTEYNKEFISRLKRCKLEKETEDESKKQYPPCNAQWSVSEGTRVWCTKNSGGIQRNWVGVPRQLYSPGNKKPHCVCVNLQEDHTGTLLKEYENCLPNSTSCNVVQDDDT